MILSLVSQEKKAKAGYNFPARQDDLLNELPEYKHQAFEKKNMHVHHDEQATWQHHFADLNLKNEAFNFLPFNSLQQC